MVHFQSANSPRQGSCHCGAVTFTVKIAPTAPALRCNCSLCAMKGVAMIGVSAPDLHILTGESELGCYRFHSKTAAHYFCKTCGIHTFHQRRVNPQMFAVNAACLAGSHVYSDFPETQVADGQNHPEDNGGAARIAGVLHYRPNKTD